MHLDGAGQWDRSAVFAVVAGGARGEMFGVRLKVARKNRWGVHAEHGCRANDCAFYLRARRVSPCPAPCVLRAVLTCARGGLLSRAAPTP